MTEPARPNRICDVCGGVDDHPRHVFAGPPEMFPIKQEHVTAVIAHPGLGVDEKARIVAEVLDTSVQQRHMDCCRSAGCPDNSCVAIAATGAEELRGKALIKHLTSGAVDHVGAELNAARLGQEA